MRTKEGLEIGVMQSFGEVQLVLGTAGHLLDAQTSLRLGHALAEASAGPPPSAFVRSVVTRRGHTVTVDREPVGTGVRILIGRGRTSRPALGAAVPVRSGSVPSSDEAEQIIDLASADAGELALELLRTAAGLPHQLTFAAWTDGAWISERRRRGDLEAAMVAALRAATANPAAARELWERIGVQLGNSKSALPAAAEHGARAARAAEVDELAAELGRLGVPQAFVRGLGDALYGLPEREKPSGRSKLARIYTAGRQVCASIIEVARGGGDR